MLLISSLEKPPQAGCTQHPFLQELIAKIRVADTDRQYHHWSDESLIDRFIVTPQDNWETSNLNNLYRLFIHAFYNTIGAAIARATGHNTETFVHFKGKELSSAVIFCGGVLVLHSWVFKSKHLGFQSLQHLIEASENQVGYAIAKANRYLDFVE